MAADAHRCPPLAGYLASLTEIIGERPSHSWEREWGPIIEEMRRVAPEKLRNVPADGSIASLLSTRTKMLTATVDGMGWPLEHARMFYALQFVKGPMGRALRQREPCYAACTYALCEFFYTQATSRTGSDAELPPLLYTHLHGLGGLVSNDPDWSRLTRPDVNGFRGFTCASLTTADCDPGARASRSADLASQTALSLRRGERGARIATTECNHRVNHRVPLAATECH